MTAPLLEVVDLHKTYQLARPNWFGRIRCAAPSTV